MPCASPWAGWSWCCGRAAMRCSPPPAAAEAGALLAFPVADAELDRWHRRMLTARVAVLDAPGPAGAPPRLLRVADPEGNVIELFAAA